MTRGMIRVLSIMLVLCLLCTLLVAAAPQESSTSIPSSQPDSLPDVPQSEVSSQPEDSQPQQSSVPQSEPPPPEPPQSSPQDDSSEECPPPASTQPPPDISDVVISFILPKGWHTGTARVGISLSDMSGVKKVEAKAVQNGSWADVSDTLSIPISDNCTVYVQATGVTGEVITKSIYVECFDRERPTVRASRSGRLLRVEAADDLSGVGTIFVDGEKFTDLTDGTLEYRLDTNHTKEETIWIQAKDKAGNLSTTVTLTNPYYIDPDKPENSTTGNTPAGSAATATPPPAAATTTPPPAADATSDPDADEEGESETEAGEIPGVIVIGNKLFITIETRDGRIFYLIIDGDRDSDNVYFVTEPSTQDLLSFITEDAAPADGSGESPAPADPGSLIDGGEIPITQTPEDDALTLTPSDDSEASSDVVQGGAEEQPPASQDAPEGDAKKANPVPGWITIAVLGLLAALAGYMFLVVLPRKKAKEAFVDNDDGGMEEEYEEPPEAAPLISVPEDDGDAEDDNPLEIPDDDEESEDV